MHALGAVLLVAASLSHDATLRCCKGASVVAAAYSAAAVIALLGSGDEIGE